MIPNEDIKTEIEQALTAAKISCEEMKMDLVVIVYQDPVMLAFSGTSVKIIDTIFLYELNALENTGLPGFEVLGYARWNRMPQPSMN